MKFVARALGVVGLLASVASCDGDSSSALNPSTYFPAPPSSTPTDPAPPAPVPYTNPACNVKDGQLSGRREMRVYSAGAVDTLSLTLGLGRYYARHELTFFTNETAQPAGTAYALDTDEAAMNRALARAFPNDDLSNEAALMADPVKWNQIVTFIANFMLRPMIDFAREHGNVGQGATNFVVVPDIERPGGMKLGEPGTTIVGIAVSPPLLALFAATGSDEGAIWNDVSLPPNFTPMMFLGNNAIRRTVGTRTEIRDLVVAHEFGHASGLEHTSDRNNLMYPAVNVTDSCLNSLSDAQLATMRTTLGVGPSAASGALTDRAGRAATLPGALPKANARPRFTPADLRALLSGDGEPMRRLLAPFIRPIGPE